MSGEQQKEVEPIDENWDVHAGWWQEHFTDGADHEYVHQIMPLVAQRLPSSGLLVDIGAGEGQVARLAVEGGMSAVGIETSESQAMVGQQRGSVDFAVSSATAIPLKDGVADAAVCCLVIEHISDLEAAFSEAARILKLGGTFLLLINHPLVQTPDSGWVDDYTLEPPESYWRVGDYLLEQSTIEEVTKGIFVRFWFRPLSRYLNVARDNGLALAEMVEPEPAKEYLAEAHETRDARFIPRLMLLKFDRLD